MKKLIVNWEDYHQKIKTLKDKIFCKRKYLYIYGIPRGGSILAYILSYETNIPVMNQNPLHMDYVTDSILIVDDIADSGKTLYNFHKQGFDIATLYKRTDCLIKPMYFGEEIKKGIWIDFPYENLEVEDTLSKVNEKNLKDRY